MKSAVLIALLALGVTLRAVGCTGSLALLTVRHIELAGVPETEAQVELFRRRLQEAGLGPLEVEMRVGHWLQRIEWTTWLGSGAPPETLVLFEALSEPTRRELLCGLRPDNPYAVWETEQANAVLNRPWPQAYVELMSAEYGWTHSIFARLAENRGVQGGLNAYRRQLAAWVTHRAPDTNLSFARLLADFIEETDLIH